MSVRDAAFSGFIAAALAAWALVSSGAPAAAHEPAAKDASAQKAPTQKASVPPPAAVIDADGLRLEGTFAEGGLILGTAPPGSQVAVDGKAVRVSPDGRFVFGFGRDHVSDISLSVTFPDGQRLESTFAIAQRTYDVQRIDGLPPRQVTPPREVLDRIRADNNEIAKARANDTPRTWFAGGFVWPAVGPISGVYGSRRILNGKPRRPHYGVDVAMPTGTPVTAPAPGRVVLAEDDMYFTGGTVILDHGHGVTSVFSHMSKVHVRVGDLLGQGDLLGEIGATGRVTGAHLDWRINWFKVRIDPELVAGPMPDAATE